MPETMPVRRMNSRQTPTVAGLASRSRAILPLNNSAASASKYSANPKPMANETSTISVLSATSFSDMAVPVEPKSRRVAISLARKPVLATVRLM